MKAIILLLIVLVLVLCSCMRAELKDCLVNVSNTSCTELGGSVGKTMFGEEFYYYCYYNHDLRVMFISPDEYQACLGTTNSTSFWGKISNKVNLTGKTEVKIK